MPRRWMAPALVSAALLTAVAAADDAEPDSVRVASGHRWHDAPGWVALRSGLVPGWGQAKNGQWLKALFVAGVEVAFIERLVFEQDRVQYYESRADEYPEGDERRDQALSDAERHKGHRRDFIWWTSLFVVLSMGDAFVDAQLRDFDVELDYQPAPGDGLPGPGGGGTIRLLVGRRF